MIELFVGLIALVPRRSRLVKSEHLQESCRALLASADLSNLRRQGIGVVLPESHLLVCYRHLTLPLHLGLDLGDKLLLRRILCPHSRDLQVRINQLLLELLDLPAELLDLLILHLHKLMLLELDLLVLVLQVIEQLAHLRQLILMLQLNHLQLRILQSNIMFD